MSLEAKREEIGKLIVCVLVSRKEACDIKELERDFYEYEGKRIPYREFRCHSVIDFLRSIPKHVTLSGRNGDYMVHPVVSEKIQHVNDLVIRQKSAKKNTPGRRRQSRPSRYFPSVFEPKPFIENSVQKEIAHMLLGNPSGVEASSIVQCLENSNKIARSVNLSNVSDYIGGVPHIAVASGSHVYPSRFLTATTDVKQEAIGHTPKAAEVFPNIPDTSSRINNVAYPGGYEEGGEFCDEDFYNKFGDEDFTMERSIANNRTNDKNDRSPNGNKPRLSSAEFISRFSNREQHQEQLQNNTFENGYVIENGEKTEVNANYAGYSNCNSEREYVSSSEDETVNVISERLQSRLKKLIEKHPDGIWCANLLEVFLAEYKFPLNYVELGFASVCELAANLKKIFYLHRWDDRGDFILYDASQPLPSAPKKSKSLCASPVGGDECYDNDDNDDIEPFPMTLALQASKELIPNGVMTQNESVGQERIPEITADEDCIEVYVADVYTPSLFWIHLRKKRAKLHHLMDAMHDFYQQEGDKYTIPHVILEKGLNCVCLFEDKWHRAIIKTVKPDGDVTLIFYDFGTTKTYSPDRVRYLHRRFSNLPAQSIACGLYNVKPLISDVWSRGASSDFWDKVKDLPLMAIVIKIDRDNNSMLISLVDTQYQEDFHINDWMVHEKLAKYGCTETVTTDRPLYQEDLEILAPDVTAESKDVPCIRPHSTMDQTLKDTIKPPPGFVQRSEPGNVAAFMDAFVDGTGYNATELIDSTYMNFCNINMKNNPLSYQNATFGPLILTTDFMQYFKNEFEIKLQKQIDDKLAEACKKLASASLNPSIVNGTILNNSNTDPSRSYTNLIPQQSNPFQQEFATTSNNFEAANEFSTNQNSSKNPVSNIASPNVAQLPNVDFTVLNGSVFNLEKLSSELPSLANSHPHFNGIFENTSLGEAQFVKDLKSTNNIYNSTMKNEEFTNQQFHFTNPFKMYAAKNVTDNVEPRREQSFKVKVENCNSSNSKPPIPPRNPNLINKSLNLTPRNATTHVKPAELPTVQNEIPATKLYYEAKPVMYNIGKTNASQTNSRPDKKILKSTDTDQQSYRNLNREPINSSSKREPVSETSKPNIIHTAQSIKQGKSSHEEHHQSHNPNSNTLRSSERTENFIYTFKPVTNTKTPTATHFNESFELDKKQNDSSNLQSSYSSKASVNEQNPLEQIHQSPGVTFARDDTMENKNLELFDAKARSIPANAVPPHYNHPHSKNPTQHYAPMYTPGSIQYGPNYPYYAPHTMQYPGTNPRTSKFRTNAPGYYPLPPPGWLRPPFYNPGNAYQYPRAPYPYQHSQVWSQYNLQMSAQKTAQPTHETETVKLNMNTKKEFHVKSVSSSPRSNLTQTLSRENEANINTNRHDQTSNNLSEFIHHNAEPLTAFASATPLSRNTPQGLTNVHSLDTPNLQQCTLSTQPPRTRSSSLVQDTVKIEENSKKGIGSTQQCSDSAILPMVAEKNKNLDKSLDQNLNSLPRSTSSPTTPKFFKPINVNNETIYLFNIRNQGWVCTDEIIQTFTKYPSRNVVLQILEQVGEQIDFMVVDRTQSPLLFSQLDSTNLRLLRMPNTKKIRGSLHLTPIKSLARLMVELRVVPEHEFNSLREGKVPPSGSILPKLVTIITSYKADDEYWVS